MSVNQCGFKTFEHQADIGIQGFGQTIEESFAQAARLIFSLMVDDLQAVKAEERIIVEVSGHDQEALFVNWLNGLICQADIHKMILSCFYVSIQGLKLRAEVWGEGYSLDKHGRGIEVKGATMTELAVYQDKGLWIAQCVVDV